MNKVETMKTPGTFKLAAIQMVSSTSVDDNLYFAQEQIARAAGQGAQLMLLPEYFALMGRQDTDKVAVCEQQGQGPMQQFMSQAAQEHGVWLVGGTIPLACTQAGKVRNTTLVYNPAGQSVARYDKVHLFRFATDKERYDEANTIEAGAQVVSFDALDTRFGLSVCYDLRFPELYRAMGPVGVILVPAAFTYTTGRAHWEILLRARAIENQCYVLACGQGGEHDNGRRTFGHSMWIDPWGQVLNCLPSGEGVLMGEFDASRLQSVRQQLPAIEHRVLP